jgi:hypothetical protein
MATSAAQSDQSSTQQSQASGKKNSHMMIYLAALIVVVVIIGVLFLAGSGGSNLPATNLPQSNASPVYLSVSNAQELLGTTIVNYTANYSTASIYNYSSPYNLTFLESMVPAFAGNVTNGWTTFAFGSGTNNASIIYAAIQTNNASNMSTLMASAIESTFPTLPDITHGVASGLNYTYESQQNSTQSYQALIGWKDGYVLSVQIEANNFTINQTELAQIVSGTV